MLFLHKLVTWTSETYLRNISNAEFTNLLLFNCQIEVHGQIVHLNVSLAKEFLVEVKKSLDVDDLGAANLLCGPALTAKQFLVCCVFSHIINIIDSAYKDTTDGVTKSAAPRKNLQFVHIV